ncbi:unnamed protein product, partial [Rotaria magnacalcarata]
MYTAASTFSHRGVQHANFECSCFTGAAIILHDVTSGPGNVARSPGDLASIPGDIVKIPWYRQI